MNQLEQKESSGFSNLGISPYILPILNQLNYTIPTPIQRQAIPVALEGKDLVGIAQTGTGKTLAFGIPLIQRLMQNKGVGLIVLPTRELALQVEESLKRITDKQNLRLAVLIGGVSMRPQINALNRNPHIIIATPGRLNDHLQQGTARMKNVKIVILDEADRMLDMGFAPQIKMIFQYVPKERQTMLFSATLAPEIMKMANSLLRLPIRVEVAPAGTVADLLTQEIFIVKKEEKLRMVEKILEQYRGPTLIFTRTKFGAKKLTRSLRNAGHKAAEIHSNRSLSQRKEALEGFKTGRHRILIATDIASRGIDVTGIELVLNYDLPSNTEDYVHRIGRTARAGVNGHAISLVGPEQRNDLRAIERLIRKPLPISPTPQLAPLRPMAANLPPTPPQAKQPFHNRPHNFNRGHNSFNRKQKPRHSQNNFPA